MIETLNKYLIQHKSINIPGLGTIFIEQLPATFDVVNKRILPPHYEFRFNKYFDTPDKEFFNYLSFEKGIPDYEAIRLYNQFAQDLRDSIKQEDRAEWEGVGVFTKNSAGDMSFESLTDPRPLYMPVPAIRVIRDKASHAVLVGDKEKTTVEMTGLLNEEKIERHSPEKIAWWVYALILFIIALIFIIFYFYQNGFTMASLANQKTIKLHAMG
jgi:hypothetical protein